MGRLKNLLGISNNLADSFVSVSNLYFFRHIESLPADKTKSFEIDILKESIKPGDLTSKTVKDTIRKYKGWLFLEISKFKIDPRDIEKAIVKISHKSLKSLEGHYLCRA
ncbi:hypothetical protein D6829_02790, partial [Candidatus Pacearchaeota archaeon]